MAIAGSKSQSRVISGNCELQLAIASYDWRWQVLTGDRKLKVAIAGCKWRSRVISGDRDLQLAIASLNWRWQVLTADREL